MKKIEKKKKKFKKLKKKMFDRNIGLIGLLIDGLCSVVLGLAPEVEQFGTPRRQRSDHEDQRSRSQRRQHETSTEKQRIIQFNYY